MGFRAHRMHSSCGCPSSPIYHSQELPKSPALHENSYAFVSITTSKCQYTQNEPQSVKTALLPRKWNLLPKRAKFNDQRVATIRKPLPLTEHDKSYLQRDLKTKLVEKWGTWIVRVNMKYTRDEARNDCYHALADQTSEKAKWELTELDMQLASCIVV